MKRILSFVLVLCMVLGMSVSAFADSTAVAQIGETSYETLQAAIDAAVNGDTITLIADITEDVTVSKNLTIDGENNNYSGCITVDNSVAANVVATIKNVNFVGGDHYAIVTNRIKSITVENCTVDNYGYGFLYANKSTPTVVVKNVTISNCNYGFRYVYGKDATLENVTMTNVKNGIETVNYGEKTITIKDSAITSIGVIKKGTATDTFNLDVTSTVEKISGIENHVLKCPDDATMEVAETVEATCTEDGYTLYTCTCGHSLKVNVEPATGHTYVDGVCACGEKEPVVVPPVVEPDDDEEEEPTYPVKIEKTENGSVKVSEDEPVKGERVTITPKAKKGYVVESVVVTDKKGNELKVTDNGDGTYSFRQSDKRVTVTVNFVAEGAVSTPSTDKANPSTGANDFVGAAVALAVVSAMGVAVLNKRK